MQYVINLLGSVVMAQGIGFLVHSQAILMYAFWLFWVPVVLQATH